MLFTACFILPHVFQVSVASSSEASQPSAAFLQAGTAGRMWVWMQRCLLWCKIRHWDVLAAKFTGPQQNWSYSRLTRAPAWPHMCSARLLGTSRHGAEAVGSPGLVSALCLGTDPGAAGPRQGCVPLKSTRAEMQML